MLLPQAGTGICCHAQKLPEETVRIRASVSAAALAAACALGIAAASVTGWGTHAAGARPSAGARPGDGTALTALMRAIPASASDPIFMHVNGIPGESLDKGHPHWIEVSAYHTSFSVIQSGQVGKPQFGGFTVTMAYSRAIPPLLHALLSGLSLGTVELQAASVSGGSEVNYLTISLANAKATEIQESSSGDRPADVMTLTATQVSATYSTSTGITTQFCFDFAIDRSC
jgi:type VI protein secretion system component Hcp